MKPETLMRLEVCTQSPEQTIEVGRRLGAVLRAGDVIGLVGRLGAGKTMLTKGIAVGLGVASERSINSPTFVLVNEYAGRIPIFHLDAYRLPNADGLLSLGFEEMCGRRGVVIVEWADRVTEAMPTNALWIELNQMPSVDVSAEESETRRTVTFETKNEDLAKRLYAAGLDRVD